MFYNLGIIELCAFTVSENENKLKIFLQRDKIAQKYVKTKTQIV